MNTMTFASTVTPIRFARFIAALALIALAVSGCVSGGTSTPSGRAFTSPDRAVDSLVAAVRSGSPAGINDVLGPDANELVHSGDAVQDKNRAERFLALYDQEHELVPADDGSVWLCIGESEWPFAIPLVKGGKAEAWRFDTERGKEEILNRWVGENELSAIQVCLAIVDAEQDYAARPMPGGGCPEYAAKVISDPGKTNGLYWEAKNGERESPLGELVASAAEEGYEPGTHEPYHGYYYRILTAQGPSADGGAYDYLVNGKLIGGFAVIARPAAYGTSGVKTFIVNHEGTVCESDLGPKTDQLAKAIKSFDPGPEWQKVE